MRKKSAVQRISKKISNAHPHVHRMIGVGILLVVLVFIGTLLHGNKARAAVPVSSHVVYVLEENRDVAENALPGGTIMPYLSGLIATHGALANNFYANTHPSIPNYHWIFSGNNDAVIDDSCGALPSSYDNIFRHLIAQGIPFRFYIEGMSPFTAAQWVQCGSAVQDPSDLGNWGFGTEYSDIQNQTAQQLSSEFVDFSQFPTDLANNALPPLTIIVPDLVDDDHNQGTDTGETVADGWLNTNLSPLVKSAYFQPGGDGLLAVGWDEGDFSDSSCSATSSTGCGGNMPMVFYGPNVRPDYVFSIQASSGL